MILVWALAGAILIVIVVIVWTIYYIYALYKYNYVYDGFGEDPEDYSRNSKVATYGACVLFQGTILALFIYFVIN